MSNNREVQKAELAGKTKLTAVTMGHSPRIQFFVVLDHDSRGHAKLPHNVLTKIMRDLNKKV